MMYDANCYIKVTAIYLDRRYLYVLRLSKLIAFL